MTASSPIRASANIAMAVLYARGIPINMIYKRVLITELIERGGLDHPVVRAVNEHAVCMVNPFHCKILHRKTSFAVISDEANGELFTTDELAAIEKFIPWTRRVTERYAIHHGERVDLMPYCRSE